jgi:hypothetical protein
MRAAVVSVGLAFLVVVGASAASGIGGFEGTWVRDARTRDDAARDAEIVRVTEPMSFAFRGFARGVMRKRMVPAERYVVEQGAEGPAIRNDAGIVFPLDGRRHATAKDHQVTSRLRDGGEIEQSWSQGSDSHGTTTWRLAADGNLIVSQRVFDSHFASPIEYSTTYRRLE